jgi:hypothetical protein
LLAAKLNFIAGFHLSVFRFSSALTKPTEKKTIREQQQKFFLIQNVFSFIQFLFVMGKRHSPKSMALIHEKSCIL